jgi:hypothetical protein
MSRHIGLPRWGFHHPVGDARSADECHAAVDDQQLAVCPVVQPREAVPAHPLVPLDTTAGILQPLRACAERAEAADRVEHDDHPHAGVGPLGERVDKLPADLAFLEDVALHVDRFARLADRVEHRRVERRAVGEDLDTVIGLQARLTRRLEHANEVIAARIDGRFDAVLEVGREQCNQDQPG